MDMDTEERNNKTGEIRIKIDKMLPNITKN